MSREESVTACLAAIEAEHTAAQRGLTDYAEVSRHEFITARMNSIGAHVEALTTLLGDNQEHALTLLLACLGKNTSTTLNTSKRREHRRQATETTSRSTLSQGMVAGRGGRACRSCKEYLSALGTGQDNPLSNAYTPSLRGLWTVSRSA